MISQCGGRRALAGGSKRVANINIKKTGGSSVEVAKKPDRCAHGVSPRRFHIVNTSNRLNLFTGFNNAQSLA
jgi:hypothetical protein